MLATFNLNELKTQNSQSAMGESGQLLTDCTS
jgi:hypothetical protein